MSNTLKAALAGLIAAIIAFCLVAYFELTGTQAPLPLPSATPSVTASPSPSPLPSPSPSPVVGVAYSPQSVVTLQPTLKTGVAGSFPDILVPTVGGSIVDSLATPKSFPFYAEMNFNSISQAFGIADQGTTIAQRGQIFTQALALLRSFGIEPIKQSVLGVSTDWDALSAYGLSYRQTVLTGNLYPPCIEGPNPGGTQNVAFLQKVEAALKTGEVPQGAWVYLYDEPTQAQHADLIKQAQVIRANAPSVRIMVTTQPTADLVGLVDIYAPIFESAAVGQMRYGSCSSSGTCSNGTPGTPTGTPMLDLDVDPVNWTAYPVVAAGVGALSVLYYDTTFQMSSAPGGEYAFGGNGDGTLLYAGTNFTVWPSARLLGIKRGLAKIAAMKAQGKPLSSLVTDSKHWSHNLADYQ